MTIEKIESISKIIAAIFIPLAIAFMGNELSVSNKKKDTETKLVELATAILTKEIITDRVAEHRNIRKWAVDVINTYSGVPMSAETQTALIEKISLPTTHKAAEEHSGTFGVVFGGDRTLKEAKKEISITAKRAGIDNAQIFLRSGSYRSVAVFTSRSEAEDALGKLKALRSSSYLVDMAKWCPNTSKSNTFFECKF